MLNPKHITKELKKHMERRKRNKETCDRHSEIGQTVSVSFKSLIFIVLYLLLEE